MPKNVEALCYDGTGHFQALGQRQQQQHFGQQDRAPTTRSGGAGNDR